MNIAVDDQTPIEDTHGDAVVEWAGGSPMIIWQENLRFHTEILQPGMTLGDEQTLPGRVQHELERLFKTAGIAEDFAVSVRWSDWDDDGGFEYLELNVWPTVDLDPEMEQDVCYSTVLWPAIATLHNVTDPGTFGVEYLFSRIPERN